MADTYEQNLSQKGTLTVSDYIRVVGSDNASYKQLVSDVAKKIIENYTGSSLAGSSQSVKSALDALNSKSERIASSNTAITLSLSANSVYMLVLLNDGGLSQYRNVSIISTGASGGTILPLAESAQITTTISGLSLTVTRSVYVSGVLYKLI